MGVEQALHSSASLIPSVVIEIRELYASGLYSQYELGRRFRVEQANISAIVRGKSWKNVGGPITKKGRSALVVHGSSATTRTGVVCSEPRPRRRTEDWASVTCRTCLSYKEGTRRTRPRSRPSLTTTGS